MSEPFDILVKSTQDPAREAIPAHSHRLASGSHVFRSMVDIGSLPSIQHTDAPGGIMPLIELGERYELLILLINLLENPLEFPPPTVNDQTPPSTIPLDGDPPGKIVPWPLVVALLDIADKYELSDVILSRLHAHVRSHAPAYPLEVYGLASSLDLHNIASLASSFLLHPPMSSYPLSQAQKLPSAAAYHLLLVLQTHRLDKLRTIAATEPIFPHEYGACSRHGTASAKLAWETRRIYVLEQLRADSKVADMMQWDEQIESDLEGCTECHLAWERATEMIRYKAGKVPREISQLPKDIV